MPSGPRPDDAVGTDVWRPHHHPTIIPYRQASVRPPGALRTCTVSQPDFRVITLRTKDTNQLIGQIDDADLKFLVDELEEESLEDTDYYISPDTIDMLEDDGAPASLVSLLRTALGTADGLDIKWSRE